METVAPPRHIKVGVVIDKTLGVMEHCAVPAAIFVVGMTAVIAALKYFTLGLGVMEQVGSGLAQFVVSLTAAYFLLDAMLRKTGLRSRGDEDVFFAYFGLSILYTLGVMLGFIAIIIPGLIIMARWALAQPMLLARGGGVMSALGSSWERTKGNEFQILVAILALFILPIAIVIACSALFDPADPVGIAVSQLASSAMSALSLAMGVALYGLMEGGARATASTFD
jgi:hypothetical protein